MILSQIHEKDRRRTTSILLLHYPQLFFVLSPYLLLFYTIISNSFVKITVVYLNKRNILLIIQLVKGFR